MRLISGTSDIRRRVGDRAGRRALAREPREVAAGHGAGHPSHAGRDDARRDAPLAAQLRLIGDESHAGAVGAWCGRRSERARKSSFYARQLATARLEEPADFARLPLTRKQDLAAAGAFDMLAVPPAHAWHYHESSGTTGQPISTWCGLAELGQMAELITAVGARARGRRRDAAQSLPVVRADPLPDGGGAAADGALSHRGRQHELGRAVRARPRVPAPAAGDGARHAAVRDGAAARGRPRARRRRRPRVHEPEDRAARRRGAAAGLQALDRAGVAGAGGRDLRLERDHAARHRLSRGRPAPRDRALRARAARPDDARARSRRRPGRAHRHVAGARGHAARALRHRRPGADRSRSPAPAGARRRPSACSAAPPR